MKIRKTRIKKTTKANGSVQHVAEYKWGFWWVGFDDPWKDFKGAWEAYIKWSTGNAKNGVKVDHSELQAKDLINYYIDHIQNSVILGTECKEYP